MLGQASDPMLQKAEQQIQSKVAPQLQDALARTVHAGLTIMYSPQKQQERMQHLNTSTTPAKDAGEGAARMMTILYNQSKKTMPTDIIVPAAMIFAFEYLDLVAKAGKAKITPQLLEQATMATSHAVLPMFGVTPDKLKQMLAQHANAAPQAAPQGIIGSAQPPMGA